ncbi:MAG: UDP-N-acetylmuramate--L-alanine ligase, partial [Thermodesulfobacteriota bacterium]
YGTVEKLEDAFSEFVNKLPFYGLAVVCLDCPRIESIIPRYKKRFTTYGFSKYSDFKAEDVVVSGFQTRLKVLFKNSSLGDVYLNVPGRHNAQNALASFAVGMELGMSFEEIRNGLYEFKGIERRIQVKGEVRGVVIIDDYAHHPEEIKATLDAIKESFTGRLILIFQPHRYTRTSRLFNRFVRVLSEVDILFLMDIYPAGEEPMDGVTSAKLSKAILDNGFANVFYMNDHEEIIKSLSSIMKRGDVVLTFGAGNVWTLGERIVKELS